MSCRNVRNRDLYVLANNNLHLTSLVLGDDTNKPWVTNRCVCWVRPTGSPLLFSWSPMACADCLS